METEERTLSSNTFLVKVTIVLLSVLTFIEVFSFLGLITGITTIFSQPLARILSFTVCTISFFGIYGLFQNNSAGSYFALSSSTFSLGLGIFTIFKTYNNIQAHQNLIIPIIVSLSINPLIYLTIYKTPISLGRRQIVSSSLKKDSLTEEKYVIETVDVEKKYYLGPNVVSAINGLNLKIRKGEFVAVMGPSGSGKSTLLNLLGALDKPSSGQVLIDNIDISMLDENALAKLRNEKIGFVFQAYNLINRSQILRNMELPMLVQGYSREERLNRIKNLLDIVGLGDKLLRKPKTLSGGEQQRVAIARALVNEPEILLADEPTGNVDSKTGMLIMKFLRKLNVQNKSTIIIVTHDPEVAKMTDRIVRIRDGKITEEGMMGVFPV